MLYYGADYYPEEWSQERWEYDARLMAEAGFNVVRLAELSWGLLEPEPDRFDFGWLDEAIDLLHRHGIATVLGTPTTAVPPWLMDLDPEALLVREDGRQESYGAWATQCYNSPVFRERSRVIVEAMAQRYRANSAVIGWQVDCEYGVFDRVRCYCDRCRHAFQGWLRRRYGDLDALRAAWGASFWSHTYSDWSQIPSPRKTNNRHNPGLVLDYARFCSDTVVGYQQLHLDILRREAPHQFVTHNLASAGYTALDLFKVAEPLDVIGWDNYIPHTQFAQAALSHDIVRSAKRCNYWMLEQQCGHLHWHPFSAPPDGVVRLMAYQSIAHGADAILYFRWRSGLIGAEQYHAGIIPHDGRPGRIYDEVKAMGRELQRLGRALDGTTPRAEVAFILSYESLWALENQAHHADLGNPWRYFEDSYRYLLSRHIPVDFCPPSADLSGYKLVIAPALFVLAAESAENLARYVEGGGTLLATVRSGQKDEHNRVIDRPFPGLLSSLFGVTVREFSSELAGTQLALRLEAAWGGGEAGADTWQEWLEPADAEVVARYRGGLYDGRPAATWRPVGRGGAMYLGTMGADATGRLLGELLRRAGVEPPLAVEAPGQVEVAVRQGEGHKVLFLLNYSGERQVAHLDGGATDLLSGGDASGALEVEPYGVRVLSVRG